MTICNLLDGDKLISGYKLPSGWQIPAGVKLAFSERSGGVSPAPYDSLNLGLHVGDDAASVLKNRATLRSALSLPSEPVWLEQVHGTVVLRLDESTCAEVNAGVSVNGTAVPVADASFTADANKVCAVMTADCLPVLFASKSGTEVAAAHAGWRGLCDGVLEATLAEFTSASADIIAYLGPAIGPDAFEVGAEVREAFLLAASLKDKAAVDACFTLQPTITTSDAAIGTKYLANLFALARIRLNSAGVELVFGDDTCTFSDPERFFSYRRERVTGRMASLIWRE